MYNMVKLNKYSVAEVNKQPLAVFVTGDKKHCVHLW